MYFVLATANASTNVGIIAATVTKKDAFSAIYDRFAAILAKLFPSADTPAAETAWKCWAFRF